MAFGPFVAIPLLLGVFTILLKFKTALVQLVLKIRLPRVILALAISVPLLIFEEHINCGAYGCTNAIIPPTLLFLLVLELIFFGLIKISRTRSLFWQTVLVSLLGISFEFFLGTARGSLRQLLMANPEGFILIIIWVGISYAFAYFLPLSILNLNASETLAPI